MPLILMLDLDKQNDKIVNIYDRDTGERVLIIELDKILSTKKIKMRFEGNALVTRKGLCDDDTISDDALLLLGK